MELGLLALATLVVCFGPHRWLLIGVVIAANVDMPTTAGNTFKHLVLATVFAYRSGYRPRWPRVPLTMLGLLSVSFVAVAAVGALRGDVNAGGKPLGGMYAIWILAQGVSAGYARQLIGAREIRRSIIVMLALGGLSQATMETLRFTSYVNAQQFALLITVLLGILAVEYRRSPSLASLIVIVAAFVAVLASGSRTALLGVVLGALVMVAWSLHKSHRRGALLTTAALFAVMLVTLAAGSTLSTQSLRALEIVDVLRGNGASVGTLSYRIDIYDHANTQLHERDGLELLFGSGAGTARDSVLSSDAYIAPGTEIDPNRALHNEWLRIIYEFGAIGLTLFLALVARVALTTMRLLNGTDSQQWAVLPLVISAPVLILFLSIENVLALGLSGSGAAFAIPIGAFLFARQIRQSSAQQLEVPAVPQRGRPVSRY